MVHSPYFPPTNGRIPLVIFQLYLWQNFQMVPILNLDFGKYESLPQCYVPTIHRYSREIASDHPGVTRMRPVANERHEDDGQEEGRAEATR